MGEGCGCKDCKRVREHVASLLPFKVLEAAAGKPLRISGVALSAGISRNFNVYTPSELEAFASELVNSPMYIEHVAVPNAIGKVTKAFYDSVSRCLMYEAEVYDPVFADKIRNGLIQHVSVGADYDTIDAVGAKVPHGLHNAELSLVAVPGIPEANIQVLERLREKLRKDSTFAIKSGMLQEGKIFQVDPEMLKDIDTITIDVIPNQLVNISTENVSNGMLRTSVQSSGREQLEAQVLNSLSHFPVREAAGDLPSDFTAFKVRFHCYGKNPCERCKPLDGKEFIYGTEPLVPLHDGCECGYTMVERVHVHLPAAVSASPGAQSGVEKLDEKELKKLIADGVAEGLKVREQSDAEKQAQVDRSQKYGIGIKKGGNVTAPSEFSSVPEDQFADPVNFRYPVDKDHAQAALAYFNQADNRTDYSPEEQVKVLSKIVQAALAAGVQVQWQPSDPLYKALPADVAAKCQGYVKEASDAEKLADTTSKLGVAKQTIEDLRKLVPGGGLLLNPPKMMPVVEHVAVLEGLQVSPMVENSGSMGMKHLCQDIRAAVLNGKERLK